MKQPFDFKVWLHLFWIFLKVNLLTTAGPTSTGLLYKECVGSIMTLRIHLKERAFKSNFRR